MSIGAVVLTQGRRPAELGAAVGSLLAQRGVEVDVVVVGNGWAPEGLPDGVRTVHLPEDVGIPGGRNAGVGAVSGDLLFFLDDDARLPRPTRWSASPRASPPSRTWGCCSCASRPPPPASRRATGCRACGSATRPARAT